MAAHSGRENALFVRLEFGFDFVTTIGLLGTLCGGAGLLGFFLAGTPGSRTGFLQLGHFTARPAADAG